MDHTIYNSLNKLRSILLEDEQPAQDAPAPANTGGATNIDAYKPNDKIPEIKASSLAQAKTIALKQLGPGKKFRFCGIYGTNLGKGTVQPQPAAGVQDQWSYLGGNNVKEAMAKLRKAARLDELKIGDIDPATGQRITGGLTDSEGNLVGSGTPGVNWNQTTEPVPQPAPNPTPTNDPVVTPVADPDVKPQPIEPEKTVCSIEDQARIKYMPSFNAAFAAARKAGCEKFAWCGVYTTSEVQAQPAEPPAATGNTSTYAQGQNAMIARAINKGVIAKTGPYTQKDVNKVLAGLADGTIGYQLDPKTHTKDQIATYSRMISNQLLKGDKRAGSNYDPNTPRVYK